jgi:hypothetical protein
MSSTSTKHFEPKTAADAKQTTETAPRKRVILSMGGKGGVGKTNVMTGLAEWYQEHQIPVTLLDLDTENKARGSLTHFFGGQVPKINIHSPEGLDAFLDYLDSGPPIILADMGGGAGRVTHTWFDEMYAPVARRGIVFTAVGVITADPAGERAGAGLPRSLSAGGNADGLPVAAPGNGDAQSRRHTHRGGATPYERCRVAAFQGRHPG